MTLHTVGVSIDFKNSVCSLVSVAAMAFLIGAGIQHCRSRGALLVVPRRHASMTTHPHASAAAPYWSWPGLAEGARLCGAMVPGTMVFAAAYGTLAAQKGLTLSEAVLMSALVFGG